MEIYIVRHGDALQSADDINRELSSKGINQSKIVGKALNKLKVKPDAIITSNLKRAIQTSKIIAKEIKFKNKIEETEILKPNADANIAIEYIKQYKNLNKILIVGHLPFLGYLIEKLISNGKVNITLKKCSLCRIDCENFEGTGNLIYLMEQNILKKVK